MSQIADKSGSVGALTSADLRTGASAPATRALGARRSRCWNCGGWFEAGETHNVDGVDVLLSAFCEECSVDVERGRWALEEPAGDPRPAHLRFRPLRFLARTRDRVLAALERRTDLIDPRETPDA